MKKKKILFISLICIFFIMLIIFSTVFAIKSFETISFPDSLDIFLGKEKIGVAKKGAAIFNETSPTFATPGDLDTRLPAEAFIEELKHVKETINIQDNNGDLTISIDSLSKKFLDGFKYCKLYIANSSLDFSEEITHVIQDKITIPLSKFEASKEYSIKIRLYSLESFFDYDFKIQVK